MLTSTTTIKVFVRTKKPTDPEDPDTYIYREGIGWMRLSKNPQDSMVILSYAQTGKLLEGYALEYRYDTDPM